MSGWLGVWLGVWRVAYVRRKGVLFFFKVSNPCMRIPGNQRTPRRVKILVGRPERDSRAHAQEPVVRVDSRAGVVGSCRSGSGCGGLVGPENFATSRISSHEEFCLIRRRRFSGWGG